MVLLICKKKLVEPKRGHSLLKRIAMLSTAENDQRLFFIMVESRLLDGIYILSSCSLKVHDLIYFLYTKSKEETKEILKKMSIAIC